MHDAQIGGLSYHSVKVAEASLALAWASGAAEHVWVDALVVGALLHDIGKVEEYVWERTAIDVSRRYFLTSHVCSGVQLVRDAVAPVREALHRAGLTVYDVDHLEHVITSHHGQPEWGAPVPPATIEATLIHHADNACAKSAALAEDLATCVPDADGWADPTGWKKRPIWVARWPAARGDRRDAVTRGLRTLLRHSGGRPPRDGGAPDDTSRHPRVTVPPLDLAEAGALVHSVWTAASTWSAARRARRAALLALADAVARQLPACEQARLEQFRPDSD
jgi:putative nucleotidyltransferase with HDIG domain